MAHNAYDGPTHSGGVSVLTIATGRTTRARSELRITKLGGSHRTPSAHGIRVKARRVEDPTAVGVDIVGEDLYALREFLSELPEEAFVRPADPVVKPPRWTDLDVVEETAVSGRIEIWIRRRGYWFGTSGGDVGIEDSTIEAAMRPRSIIGSKVRILRQASGQDL